MNKAILLLPLLLLAGCDGSLTSKQVSAANEACAPHGGVRRYHSERYINKYSAFCVDNTYIQGYVK